MQALLRCVPKDEVEVSSRYWWAASRFLTATQEWFKATQEAEEHHEGPEAPMWRAWKAHVVEVLAHQMRRTKQDLDELWWTSDEPRRGCDCGFCPSR